MKLTSLLILLIVVPCLSLMAQEKPEGNTINISGKTIEVKIPGRNEQAVVKDQQDEIKQLERSLQNELKVYTTEMQDQRFISDNVVTGVGIDIDTTDGNRTLLVTYSYSLLNDTLKFQTDDFGLGKFFVKESNALQVTLAVIKKNIEGKLARYITADKEISIHINGSADAAPIRKVIPYGGEFGERISGDCLLEGQTIRMDVNSSQGITDNATLAFLRSYAVREYLKNNIFRTDFLDLKYFHSAIVSGQRGAQFRRVTIEIIVYNAFN